MSDFTITERTEPFTLEEVFNFIDDTNISKADAHELKSRIANVVQEERNKAIDEFASELENHSIYADTGKGDEVKMEWVSPVTRIKEIAEQMKGGAE